MLSGFVQRRFLVEYSFHGTNNGLKAVHSESESFVGLAVPVTFLYLQIEGTELSRKRTSGNKVSKAGAAFIL